MNDRRRQAEMQTVIDRADAAIAPKASSESACIVVIYGPELGRRAAVSRANFEIGRSAKSDLAIDQEAVSRHHARISWDGMRHIIEDLGSTNGTFVNDQPVQRGALRDGDQIKIGRSILKFMAGDNIEANYHEEIYRLMTVDALTQAYNRRYFNEALEREFNRSTRYQRNLSLILFDIDWFKRINDTFGHVAGDSVLRQLSLVIKPRLRAQDIFCRVGGEEFAVLLPEVEIHGARLVAEKIRRLAEGARFNIDQKEFAVSVSLGVAMLDPHRIKAPVQLYELADQHLYAAKQGGRNRVFG
jgi:diguanylate cyclase (GGDEF)-like protein